MSPTQLSVLRMIPVARRIARAHRGLTVVRLLNAHRGWDTQHTPVADAVWAITALRDSIGGVPVALVGHSLGGRAALLAGPTEGVRSVVALNPWVHQDDDADLSGRQVLIVHGTEDRVALPERSAAVARTLARRAVVERVEVPEGRHAMLRHGRRFEALASQHVVETLT